MSKRQASIVQELQRAIRAAGKSGTTRYKIAKMTGLSEGALSRFMAGTRLPRIDTAERIAAAVGKRIVLADT